MSRHDLMFAICWAILLIVAFFVLTACAAKFTGICLAQGIGQTEEGLTAVAVRCEAYERAS